MTPKRPPSAWFVPFSFLDGFTQVRLQLQRFGRTGRKRQGTIHVLLAEGREDQNMDKAKASHKEVQRSIVRGDQLELYSDVERLLPANIHPQCLEKVMEIQEYVPEERPKKRGGGDKSPKKTTKRKRNDDIGRNIPMGASSGFVPVSELIVRGAKKQKAKKFTFDDFDEAAGEDDDVDAYLESGTQGPPLKKSKSASAASSSKPVTKGKLRKSKTLEPKKSKKKKVEVPKLTASQLAAKGVDDDDDLELERDIIAPSRESPPRQTANSNTMVASDIIHDEEMQSSAASIGAVAGRDAIEISDSDNDISVEMGRSSQ